jgi:hypothetical protein
MIQGGSVIYFIATGEVLSLPLSILLALQKCQGLVSMQQAGNVIFTTECFGHTKYPPLPSWMSLFLFYLCILSLSI